MRLLRTLALAAIAFIGVAGQALAGSVLYSTSGVFTPTGGGSVSTTATSSSWTVGASTLAFNFQPVTLVTSIGDFPVFSQPFGQFVLSSTNNSPTPDVFGGSFALTIHQFFPTAGSANPAATYTVSGQVTVLNTGTGAVISITIGGSNIVIDDITYDLQTREFVSVANPTETLDGSIGFRPGTPNIVPLPPAAFAGLGLLGLVGYVRHRRAA